MKELKKLLKLDNLIIMGSQEYPSGDNRICYWGGMGEVAKNISERLVQEGFEVLVLPRRVKEYSCRHTIYIEKNGVHILSPPIQSFQAGPENSDLYDTFPTSDGITALDHSYSVWRFLQRHGLNKGNPIVHVHDWLGVAWAREAKRLGFKRVFTVHMSADRDHGLRLADKRLELEKIAGNNSEIIHYVSLSQMRSCKPYRWNSTRKHVIIPNGVDIDWFKPPKEDNPEEYVFFIGRLTPVKNVPALVQGWSIFNEEYPDIGLKILGGSGISNIDVHKRINGLPQEQRALVDLKIEMVSPQERLEAYQNSTICCFPSSKEAFGIVAIEAESCGKPVVVGDVGGFKENVLEGVTGVHIDGTKAKSIAEGLELAYVNRRVWGRNARRLVEDFYDWDEIIKSYVQNLYR